MLRILRAGMFTTVQDHGRWGFQSRGVPVSGAMDLYSHRLANRLVGNHADEATLEVTLIGPHIEFAEPAVLAICGAEFSVALDAVSVAMNEPLSAPAGSRLTFGARWKGARAYIAFSGGVLAQVVLHSRSTHVQSAMGGLSGRALRAGDILPIGPISLPLPSRFPSGAPRPLPLQLPSGGARLRVILNGEVAGDVTAGRFRISPVSDRMGYRLEGRAAGSISSGERLSRPVTTGAIQVPPTGEPILLMADHATSGGYEIAGTVISADLPVAGQLAPGDWIEFEPCTLANAANALRAQEAALGGR